MGSAGSRPAPVSLAQFEAAWPASREELGAEEAAEVVASLAEVATVTGSPAANLVQGVPLVAPPARMIRHRR